MASKQLSSDLMADAYNRIGDTQYYARDFGGAQMSYDQAMRLGKNTSGDYSMYQKGMMMGLNHQYADEINQMDALIAAYSKSDLAPQAMLEKGNAQARASSAPPLRLRLTPNISRSSLSISTFSL